MSFNEKAWHVGFKWTIGNEDVPAGAIALDNTSKQLHICDIEDVGTDWIVGVDSYPSVYIHDIAAPATDYVKIYHDGTTGIYNTDGTTVFTTTASALAVALATTFSAAVTSTSTTGFRSNPTFAPDSTRTNYAYCVGNRVTELDVTMAASASQNFDPVQLSINIIGSNPTSTSTVNNIYQLITHDTIDMANLRLKCADWNITINKNLQDAYVYQGEIDYGAAATSVSGESAVMSLNMNAGTGAVTGNLRGLIINSYGAGLPSTTSIGLEVRTDGGTATLAEGIRIWSVGGNSISTGISLDGTVTEGIDFSGVTYSPDASRTNFAIGIGSRADELTVNLANAASQNFEPLQMNINFTASAGAPTSSSTARLLRIRSTHDTTDMANLRIMNINTYMDVQKNMEAAYGQMNGVDFTTNALTLATEGAVAAFNMECTSTVTGNVRGIIINLHGATLPSTSIGLEVRSDGGAATLGEGVRIWSVGSCTLTDALTLGGTITYFADFDLCSGAATTCTTDSGSAATSWKARIKVKTDDGTDAWINVYSTSNE